MSKQYQAPLREVITQITRRKRCLEDTILSKDHQPHCIPYIGQLAKAAGIPTSTLRYYEQAGLLQPLKRAENNYRTYTSDALQTIRFIRTAQAAGFTLADVRTFLTLRAGDMTLCKDVQPLIAKRVQDVSAHIQEMQQVLTVLQAFLAQCHAQAQDDTCHVLAALAPSVS